MVVLLMLSSSLKDLAVELELFIETATQVNRGDDGEKNGIKNQNNLRGSVAIADKCDVAYIFDRPTPDELNKIAPFLNKVAGIEPNQVLDLYKIRRSRLTNIRIWSYFDYGTCRKQDLFITKGDFGYVENFTAVKFFDKNIANYEDLLNELNNSVVQTPKEIPKTYTITTTTPIERIAPKINKEEVTYF